MREPRWQNWLGLLLGISIIAAPWAIPEIFSRPPASIMTDMTGLAAGSIVAGISLLGVIDPKIWIDWLKFLLGFCLLLAPWLPHSNDDIFFAGSLVFAGMLLIVISGLAFASRRPRARGD